MHNGIDAALIPVVHASSSCRQSKTLNSECHTQCLVVTLLLLHDLLELLTHLLHHHVDTHDIHARTPSANRDNVKVLKSPLLISPAQWQSCTAAPPTHHLPAACAACTRTALVAALPAAGPLKVSHVFAVLLTSVLLSALIQSHLERVVNTAVSWGYGCRWQAPRAWWSSWTSSWGTAGHCCWRPRNTSGCPHSVQRPHVSPWLPGGQPGYRSGEPISVWRIQVSRDRELRKEGVKPATLITLRAISLDSVEFLELRGTELSFLH